MLLDKLYIPLIIASQHPIYHFACVSTSLILLWARAGTEYYSVNWDDEQYLKKSFILFIINNSVCFTLEMFIRIFTNRMYRNYEQTESMENSTRLSKAYNFSYVNQLLILAKTLINILTVIYVEISVLDIVDPRSPLFVNKLDHPKTTIWLYF